MSYRVAVVGDFETTVGFALAGATDVYVHEKIDETLAKLAEFFANKEIGIVLITNRVKEELGDEFRRMVLAKGLFPLVLAIPDKTGYMPLIDEFHEMIKRTVGTDIVVRAEGV